MEGVILADDAIVPQLQASARLSNTARCRPSTQQCGGGVVSDAFRCECERSTVRRKALI